MKRFLMAHILLIKRLYKWLKNFIEGDLIGEELVSLNRHAGTVGVENWKKKEYRYQTR